MLTELEGWDMLFYGNAAVTVIQAGANLVLENCNQTFLYLLPFTSQLFNSKWTSSFHLNWVNNICLDRRMFSEQTT